MPPTARITIANRIPEIRRAADFLDAFIEQHPVPDAVARELHVIVDEVLSNAIRHGYEDDRPHEIGVTLARSAQEITLEVDDDGKPFDPTTAPAPPSRARRGKTSVGGLGLVFVRELSDSVSYRHDGARNRLTVRLRLDEPATPGAGSGHLALSETEDAGIRILETEGRLDSTSAWAMKDRLLGMIESGARRIIVDVSRTGYIGSAGFWALLLIDRALRARRGSLALCGLKPEFARALDDGGFASLLSVHKGRAEALEAARAEE
jgi:serine/threonine-protein kinase RsbW